MEKTTYALITGASSGIGKALSRRFARDGYGLVLVSEDKNELAQVETELRNAHPGIQTMVIAADLTQDNGPENVYEEIRAGGLEVSALINDAGVGVHGRFSETSVEKDMYMIALNIVALTKLTKLFLPQMLVRKQGRILNLGSIAGFQPGPLFAVYHATKAYVLSFSEALAEELDGTGVSVTCLCPGPTATHFFDRAGMLDANVVKKWGFMMMDADEVAEAGYKALLDGEHLVVPGLMNKTLTFLRRVMPKSIQAKTQKRFYESSEED